MREPLSLEYDSRHPGAADVIVLVGVSDTTIAFDRHTKLCLYARFCLPEVWLVDLPAGVLERHREPEEGAYTRLDRLGHGDLAAVPLPGIPDSTIDLSGLLQPPGVPSPQAPAKGPPIQNCLSPTGHAGLDPASRAAGVAAGAVPLACADASALDPGVRQDDGGEPG